MISRRTIFSACRKYRYTLWREWDMFNPSYCQFIGLNPSTADEVQDDPTVRRCIDFAKRWGFGALCMTNAFAWRETEPDLMKLQPEPVSDFLLVPGRSTGVQNDHFLLTIAQSAGLVVAAWGKDGKHLNRDLQIVDLFARFQITLHCLGTNKNDTPKHPLYLRATTQPQPYALKR